MLKMARFFSLFLLALLLGTSYSHLLQWAPKANLPAEDFLSIHQVLLSQYGVGIGWIEGLAAIVIGFVAFLLRCAPRQFALTLIACLCLVAMILIWAIWINPINTTVNSWSTASIPADWQSIRSAWHQLHATRFALAVIAFGTFLWASLVRKKVEQPTTREESLTPH